jgi:hypothetical protein
MGKIFAGVSNLCRTCGGPFSEPHLVAGKIINGLSHKISDHYLALFFIYGLKILSEQIEKIIDFQTTIYEIKSMMN